MARSKLRASVDSAFLVEVKTTLPLTPMVDTSVTPSSSTAARSSGIPMRFALPTLMPRRRAMKRATARRLPDRELPPAPARAGSAARPPCGASWPRPGCRSTTWSPRCSSARASTSRSRSRRCPGVVQHTRESLRKEVARARRPRRARRHPLRRARRTRTPTAARRGIPTASSRWRCATCATTSATTIVLMADLCLDEYTDHGHCGVLDRPTATVDNDATLELYAKVAVAQAEAGADVVAPSRDDGRPGRRHPRRARRRRARRRRRSWPTRPSTPPPSTARSATRST